MSDPVRKRIRQLIGDNNLDMKGLSLALGKKPTPIYSNIWSVAFRKS